MTHARQRRIDTDQFAWQSPVRPVRNAYRGPLLDGDEGTARFTDIDGTYMFLRDTDFLTHRLSSVFPTQAAGSLPGDTGPVGIQGGRWLHTSPTEVDLLAGSTYKDIVFDVPEIVVDWGNLIMGQASTTTLATSPGYWHNAGEPVLAANDEIEYRWTARWDGNIMLIDAFRSMDDIASVA